ncbi:hypothetical protein CGRA01v4_03659 [Colletotrichum graminicola]|nr:hypothetical protein CGRA01v4_03659 [Colletotrichum graminicola]
MRHPPTFVFVMTITANSRKARYLSRMYTELSKSITSNVMARLRSSAIVKFCCQSIELGHPYHINRQYMPSPCLPRGAAELTFQGGKWLLQLLEGSHEYPTKGLFLFCHVVSRGISTIRQ